MSTVSFLWFLMDDSDQGKKYPCDPVKILEVSWKNPGSQFIFKLGSPNTCLLLSSKGKASTCWCEFLAGTMMQGSLKLYTAAIEVIREKIALPERQELRTSEGDHTMSVHCFIPTWLQKMTVEDSRRVGMPDRRKSSKRRTTGPSENPMQTAVDFHLLVNKHVSYALGSLADI